MDNTSIATNEEALATLFYSVICGAVIDAKIQKNATKYWKKQINSPWSGDQDERNLSHAQAFFQELADIQNTTDLRHKWAEQFSSEYRPANPQVARDFLSECFRLLIHKPRSYHNFFCQQQTLSEGHFIDFPIRHPIAVEFWTLYACSAGVANIQWQSESITLKRGQLALIPPGCHCTVSRDPGSTQWTFDWLSFRSRSEWFEVMDCFFSLDMPLVFNVTEEKASNYLRQLFAELQSTTYRQGDINEKLCHNLIENLLIRLGRQQSELQQAPHGDPRVRKALQYLIPRYRENLSVADIANQANLSPSRLNTLFRQHYGISLIKWRDNMRMQKAQEMLNHTTMPIATIASHLGYEDPLYFSRRYRSHFGQSPSQQRKN